MYQPNGSCQLEFLLKERAKGLLSVFMSNISPYPDTEKEVSKDTENANSGYSNTEKMRSTFINTLFAEKTCLFCRVLIMIWL